MKGIIIPLDDWAAGRREFRFQAGLEFFQKFGNEDILDAAISIRADVDKKGAASADADISISGTLTVSCDRCLEPVSIPIEKVVYLKAGRNPSLEGDLSEDGREPVELEADGGLDISQVVYDYSLLSLPMQRIHPEGKCNPDTVIYLGREERKNEEADIENSPFSALKGLFK